MLNSLKISLKRSWLTCVSLLVIIGFAAQLGWSQNLNGYYREYNNGHYYVRTIGNTVYWFGEDSRGDWAHVFQGTLNATRTQFTGQHYDVPKGRAFGTARHTFRIDSLGTSFSILPGYPGPNGLRTALRQHHFPTNSRLGDRSCGRQESTITNITGCWDGNDGGKYYMSQGTHPEGEVVIWFGEQSHRDGRPGFSNIAIGTRNGNTITLDWVDVPKGTASGQGTLRLNVDNAGTITRLNQTGGFGGSRWTRGSVNPPPPTPLTRLNVNFHNVTVSRRETRGITEFFDVGLSGDSWKLWGEVRFQIIGPTSPTDSRPRVYLQATPYRIAEARRGSRDAIWGACTDNPCDNRCRTYRPGDSRLNGPNYTVDVHPDILDQVFLYVTMQIQTYHKDNDFAVLGWHGMAQSETYRQSLRFLLDQNANRNISCPGANSVERLWGSETPRYCSTTDRVHCFSTLFSVSPRS